MYLRRCYRRKDGKRHAYWALVESYRTARGPRREWLPIWANSMNKADSVSGERRSRSLLQPKPTCFNRRVPNGLRWI